jgi:fructose-1,6-bisphosphatase
MKSESKIFWHHALAALQPQTQCLNRRGGEFCVCSEVRRLPGRKKILSTNETIFQSSRLFNNAAACGAK